MAPKKMTKQQRIAARLRGELPKRVCNTKDCDTVLSSYNDDNICNTCFNAIPIKDRPYRYRAF